jgi:putative membrane protein
MINLIKGLFIGLANIIPGVSGGSFALILGIYTRLIDAISNLNLKIFIPSRFREEFKKADGLFLIQIIAGAIIAIAALARLMDYLLKYRPAPTLSFFAGLIIASVLIPYGMIGEKKFRNLIYILPGFLAVWGIYTFQAAGPAGPPSLIKLFISAAVAISAMVLPGISGSFVLLILGVYQPVIGHIKNMLSSPSADSLFVLVVFGLGCIAGLIFFVRIMKILLHRKRDKTLAFLVGLVAGSLIVLWPFKDYPEIVSGEKIDIAIITAKNIAPASPAQFFYYLTFFIAGIAGGRALKLLEKKRDN